MSNVIDLKSIIKPIVCIVPDHGDYECDGVKLKQSVFAWAFFLPKSGELKSDFIMVPASHNSAVFENVVRIFLKKIFLKWPHASKPIIHYPYVREYSKSIEDTIDKVGLHALKSFAREHDYRLVCSQLINACRMITGEEKVDMLQLVRRFRRIGIRISKNEPQRAKAIAFLYYQHNWKWMMDNERIKIRRKQAKNGSSTA